MKKITTYVALALAVSAWTACSSNSKDVKPEETPLNVEVTVPAQQDSTSVSVSGKLSARNSAEISTRMMSYVEKVFVKPGDRVQQGQVLIHLNANEWLAKKKQVMAQIATAQLAAENAAKDYQRFKNLHAKESVSDKELENMELNKAAKDAQLEMARQGLKEVEAMLTYTDIRAPFAGTITQKYIDEGSLAKPGMPLLTLEQGREMEVTATVPEYYISQVAPNDRVEVEVKSLQHRLKGTISELSPSASQNGGQYAMKIRLDEPNDSRLLSGMYVVVRLPKANSTSPTGNLLIDKDVLVVREQLTGVYVVNSDSRAVLRWLRLGKSFGNQVEVLSGLSENDRIIVKAPGKLYNGRMVSVK